MSFERAQDGDVVEAPFGFRGVVVWERWGESFINWTHVWRPVFDEEGCAYLGDVELVELSTPIPGCRVDTWDLVVIKQLEGREQ